MSDKQRDDWPPIIFNANRPAWVVWRALVITAFMWVLFLLLLWKEIELGRQALLMLAGHPVEVIDAGFTEFLEDMRPTGWITLILLAFLGAATLLHRLRRITALRQPQPAPASDRELVRDLGLSEEELNDLRQQKIVALNVDEQGRVSVQSNGESSVVRADD
jgi:poly-beta-1,6-N-acetyl-D-glucosamine biosynthesis protein PgaD